MRQYGKRYQECTTIAEDWHKCAPILTTHWSKLASTRRLKRAPTSGEMCQYGKGYAPRMHQDRRRLAQTCPNFDHPLEQACISNKNDKKTVKTNFLTLVGPHFSWYRIIFYSSLHRLRKRPPAQVKPQRKSSQVDQHGRKTSSVTAAKPST